MFVLKPLDDNTVVDKIWKQDPQLQSFLKNGLT
jgi:hypothetical protein